MLSGFCLQCFLVLFHLVRCESLDGINDGNKRICPQTENVRAFSATITTSLACNIKLRAYVIELAKTFLKCSSDRCDLLKVARCQ